MTRTYSKTCERCGRTFQCGLSRCRCANVPVSDAQYDRIMKQYHDCLCMACLEEITGHASGSSVPESLK